MKLNQEKCHFLVSGNKFENIWAEIGHAKIWENPKQELLGVVIDRDLSFDGYLSSLCRKAGTQTDFIKPYTNTTRYGLKSLNFFASKVWDMILDKIKSSCTVEILKNKIRNW